MRLIVSSLAVAALCACGGNTKMSARVGAPLTAGAAPLSVATGISLDRVRIVVSKVELKNANEAQGDELEAGPYLLDLSGASLEGGVVQQFSANIPQGTYDGLEMEIHKLSDGESVTGALAEMKALNASIALDGTVDGAAFTFTSEVDETRELPGPFNITSGENNVTLNVDPSSWFLAAGGARLDPSDPNNRSQFEANIMASITGLEDDNEDGRED